MTREQLKRIMTMPLYRQIADYVELFYNIKHCAIGIEDCDRAFSDVPQLASYIETVADAGLIQRVAGTHGDNTKYLPTNQGN